MNCSCSSNQCPHIKFVRTLLETTDKDQVREKETPPCTGWQKTVPHLQKAACHIATTIKVIFYIWLTITKVSLQLWLHVLESNRYLWLGFLVFAFGLISSLPGVRGSGSMSVDSEEVIILAPTLGVDAGMAGSSFCTELIVMR